MTTLCLRTITLLLAGITALSACASQPDPTQAVDSVGTMAAEMAASMLSQTAAAASPTPAPATETPIPSDTATPEPTKGESSNVITVVNYTACYRDGPLRVHVTNINVPKPVKLLGVGSEPGWYIINAPYFYSPCWIAAADVEVPPEVDLSAFPIMTPAP
jgi:hypothetical protein